MNPSELTRFQESPPLILIVDDEQTLRAIMRRILEQEGYQVVEAKHGEQCLAFCKRQLPDMILLDAMMPVLDGFACCDRLHSILGEGCPPILMITALNDKQSVDTAFAAGAMDYITKPIHWAVLRQRVRRILQTNWAMKELRRKIEQVGMLMADLEHANRELQRLASIDSLTQIANRRAFDDYLQQQWQQLAKEQRPIALILCDIDFFKAYNDTFGHQAGDECLKQVATIIRCVLRRPDDLAARYGGEEFAVVLPNTEIQEAVRVAQRIQDELRTVTHQLASPICSPLTLSFGVAGTVPTPEISLNVLVGKADKALYQAKLAGRDRIICSSSTAV